MVESAILPPCESLHREGPDLSSVTRFSFIDEAFPCLRLHLRVLEPGGERRSAGGRGRSPPSLPHDRTTAPTTSRLESSTITMDAAMVDIGQDSAHNSDEVVLLGPQGHDCIHVEELAEWLGTIPYEILTMINTRVPRHYVGDV